MGRTHFSNLDGFGRRVWIYGRIREDIDVAVGEYVLYVLRRGSQHLVMRKHLNA
jgi:hypothetical protein